jgi:hypothetical protein
VDTTGSWTGSVTSVTATGEPVYGSYEATVTLRQSGSAIEGSYGSSVGISGTITGTVAADRVSFKVMTANCPGQLNFTGLARIPAGAPATMEVRYAGSQNCTGEQYGTGSLTRM